ncbi:Bcr/CflA family efflux MFS transporter [Microbacterium phyllosphaerae]|uniref:Bcr/CflA family efflux MFS transporter n=1 Tax=Microbacterium phyllosphaerae TaxID=124798 RepID=UPI003D656CDD
MSARLILLLGFVSALGPLSIDLYVPAFPDLQRDLGLDDVAVQVTLASMTGGLALGQAIVGTWSDRVGRRRPLIIASAMHCGGSILCVCAPDLEALLAGRVLQGVGASGGAVLVVAVIRDIATREQFLTLLVRVNLVITGAPLLAPVGGALLLPLVGWRGLFAVLAALGGLLHILIFRFVPETVTQAAARPHRRLRVVLGDAQFRWAVLAGAATYAGVYAYVAASPLLLRNVLGLPPTSFALVFLFGSIGLLGGVQLGGALAKRLSPGIVLLGGSVAACISALLLLAIPSAGPGGVAVTLWMFVSSCGVCFPCASTLALSDHSKQAGTASSAYGFITFASAALVSPLPGLIGVHDASSVAVVLGATSSLCVVVAGIGLRRGARCRC